MKLFAGIALAAIFWFLLFFQGWHLSATLHNNYFWYGMTAATLVLTAYAFASDKAGMLSVFSYRRSHLVAGVIHGIILYFISRAGVLLLSWLFPETKNLIAAVYGTRTQLSSFLIAMLLLFIIAPAEEIFWRGFVQRKIAEKTNASRALVLTTLLYSAVHIWALNPVLLLAALVLGIHWGFMYKRFGSIVPGLVSHALWDTLIFVIFPVVL